jgi:hypothetical protein
MGKSTKRDTSIDPCSAKSRSVTPIFYFIFGRPITSTTQYAKIKKFCGKVSLLPNVLKTDTEVLIAGISNKIN